MNPASAVSRVPRDGLPATASLQRRSFRGTRRVRRTNAWLNSYNSGVRNTSDFVCFLTTFFYDERMPSNVLRSIFTADIPVTENLYTFPGGNRTLKRSLDFWIVLWKWIKEVARRYKTVERIIDRYYAGIIISNTMFSKQLVFRKLIDILKI